MSNQVSTIEPTLPGLLPNVEARRLVDSFRIFEESNELMLDRMPTVVERQVLASRVRAIEQALAPIKDVDSEWNNADSVIAGLLIGYGTIRAMSEKAVKQTITTYMKHLEEMPLFAIRSACDDVQAGRVYDVDPRTGNRKPLDPDYPPSTIRLRSVAQKHVDRLLDERVRFDRVMRAKRAVPPPLRPEERAKIAAGFEELKRSMAAASAEEELERAERGRRKTEEALARSEAAILAEYRRLELEPVQIGGLLVSPQLARRHVALRSTDATLPDDDGAVP